ncbi:MAG: tyrosine-type recombinase/integrase [Propylenella sp.]
MRSKPVYPGLHEFTDRHGKGRAYLRRPGHKLKALPWPPGTREFIEAYEAAMAELPAPIGEGRVKPGSIDALALRYYASAEFAQLAATTRATYRGIIERFRAEHGSRPIALLERRHVKAMMDARAATPAAANNFLRMVRMLMSFAIEIEWRRDDPTRGIKNLRMRADGFHTWTDGEIAEFEARHPIGGRPRLALALLLFTGQRRSDLVTMGRQHLERDGSGRTRLRVRQQKTGVELRIPVHDALAEILSATAGDHLTFLTTGQGRPFSAAGFGNWFRECCNAADLPHCSAHGLRKAAARRLAEAGCTPHEIMAITGHRTLKEVERYTRAAELDRLGEVAIRRLSRVQREQALANRLPNSGKPADKSLSGKDK